MTRLKVMKKKRRASYCSFCGKNEGEVFKLISGPMVCICDECIAACQELLVEDKLERGVIAVIGRKRGA
jgi:ATP-dependent Clp protease ATP-binding subunit ClpX